MDKTLKRFKVGTKVWVPNGKPSFYEGVPSRYSVIQNHTVFGWTRLVPEAGRPFNLPSFVVGFQRYYEPGTVGRLWQSIIRGFRYRD